MALGSLLAAYALEVSPLQAAMFEGGDVANLEELKKGLDEAAASGKIEQGLAVTLKVDQNRSSPVRDAVMQSAFGKSEDRLKAIETLAGRLGQAMDKRSTICLLVASIHELSDLSRQVVLWTFPRERVIRRAGGRVDINDAFSLNSRLRKAALMRGYESRDGFLTARVLDLQTTNSDRIAANFWIVKFLDARPQIGSAEGTTMTAQTFRQAYANVGLADQEVLQTAIEAVRKLTDRQWSLEAIANDLMAEGNARKQFLKAAGAGDSVRATFLLDSQEFDRLLGFHVFRLTNGVRVTAPVGQIGAAVFIDESDGRRTLSVEGEIMDEKLTKRA